MLSIETTEKTISWWLERRQDIDMEPKYQRNGNIWPLDYKQLLIDSIINGFDMPKFYIADNAFQSERSIGKKRFAIIDGKQRFGAIFGFYDDEFPLSHDVIFLEEPEHDLSGLYYSDIYDRYPRVSQRFEQYKIQTVEINSSEPGIVNEIFLRLNHSISLNKTEIRNAKYAEATRIIGEISNHEFFTKLSISNQRSEYNHIASKLLLLEFTGGPTYLKDKNIDQMLELSNSESEDLSYFKERVLHNLDWMSNLFLAQDPLLKKVSLIPTWYQFLKNFQYQDHELLADFLHEFDEIRTLLSTSRHTYDQDIVSQIDLFNKFNKNPDDRKSIESRVAILSHALQAHARKRRL